MVEWIGWVRAALSRATDPWALASAALVLLLLLALREEWIGEENFREVTKYRTVLGVILIVVIVLLFVRLLRNLFEMASQRISKGRKEREVLAYIDTLSRQEKLLLQYMLTLGQQTVWIELSNPYALSLTSKGLLVQSGARNIVDCHFTMPRFVWDRLTKNRVQIMPADETSIMNFNQDAESFIANPLHGVGVTL